MKRAFGTFLSRLLYGGTQLTDPEYQVLCLLVQALPDGLRNVVELQFAQYDLVQRELDGRALNFYCKSRSAKLPLLALRAEQCPLVRIVVQTRGELKAVHAVLAAVNGRAFCVSMSERIDRVGHLAEAEVIGVVQSWRSNVAGKESPPIQSIEPACAA